MKTKKLPQAIAELKDYRERNGLTYQELADRMNQDPSYNMDPSRLRLWIVGESHPLDTSLKQVELFLRREYTNDITNYFSKDVKYIDSRLISQWAGKEHKNLLGDIRNHIRNLKKAQTQLKNGVAKKLADPLDAGRYGILDPDLYFIESSYIHPQNKTKYPSFLVSRLGCELIANKMTGVKGTQFTALYINEFHRLRNEAEEIPAPQEAPQIEQESLFDHEPQAPQTQEERDLEYLKRRLLDGMIKSNTALELGKNIVKTLELITVLDK